MSLFVIGSLTEGMVHFSRLKEFILHQEPAQVLGTAYRLKVGFPVLAKVPSVWVNGLFLQLKESDLLMSLLDEFHGYDPHQSEISFHHRETVEVKLSSGQMRSAQTYFINPMRIPSSAIALEDGDWRKDLAVHPPLTEKLTDRQKAYVLKLGASAGRDILPIDLGLYRELLNLEIIIDKGRRLALTKFGLEVYRYLS